MITLKVIKAILLVCDVKNSNKAFSQSVTNWQLWVSFLLKIKIKQKRKLGSLLFLEENSSKTFKNCQVIRGSTFKISHDGSFWGHLRICRLKEDGGGLRTPKPRLPKTCYTCPTRMKFGRVIAYLKRIQINI